MLIKMHLPVFAMFGMLSITVPGSLAGLLVNRQANPMLTPSSTPSAPSAPQSTSEPAPEPPTERIYSIPLAIGKDSEWGYPAVLVTMDELRTPPIKLAVSFHSNETWLRTSSKKVCIQPKRNSCYLPKQVPPNPKEWAYTGQNGLVVTGGKYTFSSFGPFESSDTEQGTNWRLDNFGVGVAWDDGSAVGLGTADGVLGLGPGSTFLQSLTGSSEQAISVYLGKDSGTLVIGGYHPKQASGNFVKQSIGEPGVLELQVENLSIKGDQTNLLKTIKAIIDPGSPYIIIPKSVQEALAKNKNTEWTIDGDELRFGRSKEGDRASFILNLGEGISVEIAEDAYTLPEGPAFRVGAENQLVLGRPFLHSTYIIVDNTHNTFHVAQADTKKTDTDTPKPITDFEDKKSEETESPNNEDSDTELDPSEDSNSDSDSDSNSEPSNTKTKSNDNDSPESEDDDDDESGKQIKIAAIIGGIVGALVLVAVIFGVFLWRRRRSVHQVHEIQGYMGTSKRLSEGSDFDIVAVSGARSQSPQQLLQEDTYLMEGYHPVQQQHPPGSRGSMFREEMNFSGPTPLPPSMQYQYEEDDHLGGFQGSTSSSRPLRRDQDLMRADSIISTTDVHVPTTTDRSAPHVPRLPMFHSRRPDSAAL